ncbi:MAG: TetR/AcrR family transcriptional regulator [Pseudomonadota bacterium]
MNATAPVRAGRPKSDTKRRAILRAAVEIFMEVGYERTSMDAVAATAGVSKQTVYSHFSGKEDLFRECILNKILDYGLDLQDQDPAAPIHAVLVATGERFLNMIYDDETMAMYRLLIAESPAFPSIGEAFWESGPVNLIESLTAFLVRASKAGSTAIAAPQQAAEDFLCLLKRHYIQHLLRGQAAESCELDNDEHIERVVHQVRQLHDKTYQGH